MRNGLIKRIYVAPSGLRFPFDVYQGRRGLRPLAPGYHISRLRREALFVRKSFAREAFACCLLPTAYRLSPSAFQELLRFIKPALFAAILISRSSLDGFDTSLH